MAKEDKIQQILICAKELFGLYGYDKVSMRDIADRAGISVGNLTYYYGRKERIMLAVLDQINEEVSRPADIPGTLAEVDAMLERFSKIAAQSSWGRRCSSARRIWCGPTGDCGRKPCVPWSGAVSCAENCTAGITAS